MSERSQVIIHHSPEIAEQSCERANGMEGATCKMWIEEGLVRYHCGSTDWMGEWWIQQYCYVNAVHGFNFSNTALESSDLRLSF
eukprot:UN22010